MQTLNAILSKKIKSPDSKLLKHKFYNKNNIFNFSPLFSVSLIIISAIYLLYPSAQFNADALHYNILSFAARNNFSLLINDESTPVHFAWHFIITILSKIGDFDNLHQNILYLEFFNIIAGLLFFFVFAKLVKKTAGDKIAAISVIFLSFSNALSIFFLSLEVYSFNSLFICITFYYLLNILSENSEKFAFRQIYSLATLIFINYLFHLTNLIFIPVLILFFSVSGKKNKLYASILFISVFILLFSTLALLLTFVNFSSILVTLKYMFAYGKKTQYLGYGFISNLVDFVSLLPYIIISRFKILPVILFGYVLYYIFKRKIQMNNFRKFLAIYLILNFIFFSQWDSSNNLKLKIIFIPASILFLVSGNYIREYAFSKIQRVFFYLLIFSICLVNFYYSILPNSNILNNHLYQQAKKLHLMTQGRPCLLIDYASRQIKLASVTFFNDLVEFVDSNEVSAKDKIEFYKKNNYLIINKFE